MIGVILCTHSDLADGLQRAVEMIAGKQEHFDSICFYNGDSLEGLEKRLKAVAAVYEAKKMPYCFIVDLYAATPFNTALKIALESGAPVISGANLPLLLDLLLSREAYEQQDLQEFLCSSMERVQESMQVIDPNQLSA